MQSAIQRPGFLQRSWKQKNCDIAFVTSSEQFCFNHALLNFTRGGEIRGDAINVYYRPSGGGRLFDMQVVSSYVFLRTDNVFKKSKGKIYNTCMLLPIRDFFLLFKKIIYLN